MNEAELVFTDVLQCDRVSLYSARGVILNRRQLSKISSVFKRRLNGEPLQYILGKTEFMGFEFKVNRSVLIPRPETEIMVEECIGIIRNISAKGKASVLDIGTGSGCIAVSLAKLCPKTLSIDAVDISGGALSVAADNAHRNGVAGRINFIKSDLFKELNPRKKYDLIVSNPPYVERGMIGRLEKEIHFEPRLALDGGDSGLDFYKAIISDAPSFMKENGFIVFEAGLGQAERIKNIFYKNDKFEIIGKVKDYNDIERVIIAKYG
ncbi:MAG: peptide chain release factor N(5)-glutamine methyltransferase [Candidatus Omnitrophota bacterium]|jgi:release factor glutamine methyltransferase|nr:MAG: peptide chain release factor N(5)-glutamine methyltransferase [Candidatus Omnitrophota bacterium]